MIEEGYYSARASQVTNEHGHSVYCRFGRAGTGTIQCLMMFEIMDGEYAGTRLPWFGSFSGNSWERTVESLRYCGFQGDDVEAINSQALDRVVTVKVEHDEHNGRIYSRVAFVNKPGGHVNLNNPFNAAELRTFAAQMRQRIGALSQRSSAPSGISANLKPSEQLGKMLAQMPPYGDDDLPF